MSPGANTTQPTSADQLSPLFDQLEILNREWRDIALTPKGRLRRSHTYAQQSRLDAIRNETTSVHDQIKQIIKDA